MNFLNSLIAGAILAAGSICAGDFGFNIGPFDLQFGIRGSDYSEDGYVEDRNFVLDNAICMAISNQQQLGLIVQGEEIVNSKEIKRLTKRLIVEPYAFGVTKDGKPILRGKVISEKLIEENTIKFGEEKFNEPKKDKKIFGSFQSADKKNIDIRNISKIQVLADSHFDVPKNFEGIKDDKIRVICQLPVESQK